MYPVTENPVFLHIIRLKMAGYMYFEISARQGYCIGFSLLWYQ